MPTVPSPHELLPSREHCALLVIDVQERLLPSMPPMVATSVLRNTGILIAAAREFSLPLLVSEQYPKGLGETLPEIKAALPEDCRPFHKIEFSCCAAPGSPLPQAFGERDVIICGMETHVCVLQTTLDLLSMGRRVYLAADATCSRAKHNWQFGLEMMRQAGAIIGTTEIFAFALLGAAGSEQFKRISRLVKE